MFHSRNTGICRFHRFKEVTTFKTATYPQKTLKKNITFDDIDILCHQCNKSSTGCRFYINWLN